jgi:hypothetical protein
VFRGAEVANDLSLQGRAVSIHMTAHNRDAMLRDGRELFRHQGLLVRRGAIKVHGAKMVLRPDNGTSMTSLPRADYQGCHPCLFLLRVILETEKAGSC